MRIEGDDDWGNSGYGWRNKPYAPMPNDEDMEKAFPIKS